MIIVYTIAYNSQERIDRLYETIPQKFHTVLIDNGPQTVRAPWGEYVRTGPQKFTAGANDALRHALRNNAVPIVLNDDVEIEGDALDVMAARVLDGWEGHRIGVCAPMQVDIDAPDKVIAGGFGAAFPSGQHRIGHRTDEALSSASLQRWVTFCAVAISPKCLEDVGLLDPNFEMWFSDSDFCMRCNFRPAGQEWGVLYEPAAVVRHRNHAACGERYAEHGELHIQMTHDQSMFHRKWGGDMLKGIS